MSATPAVWTVNAEKRAALAEGQQPIACVVTCSDSRVIPEMIFDQSLGTLFVVRNYGNVPSADVLASVEYAVAHLHVPLVIVLGHTDCDAAAAGFPGSVKASPQTTALHAGSTVVVNASDVSSAALPGGSSETNARLTAMSLLCESPAISAAVAHHETSLISGLYDLHSGKATFETELAGVSLPVASSATVTAEPAAVKAEAKPAESTTVVPAKDVAAPAPKAAASTVSAAPKKPVDSASFARRSR